MTLLLKFFQQDTHRLIVIWQVVHSLLGDRRWLLLPACRIAELVRSWPNFTTYWGIFNNSLSGSHRAMQSASEKMFAPSSQPHGLLVCDHDIATFYNSLYCHDAAIVDNNEVLFAISSTNKARYYQKLPSSMMKECLAETLGTDCLMSPCAVSSVVMTMCLPALSLQTHCKSFPGIQIISQNRLMR